MNVCDASRLYQQSETIFKDRLRRNIILTFSGYVHTGKYFHLATTIPHRFHQVNVLFSESYILTSENRKTNLFQFGIVDNFDGAYETKKENDYIWDAMQ